MNILGVSGGYFDAAAALVQDGVVRGAAMEERFTRIAHDPALPLHRMLADDRVLVTHGQSDAFARYLRERGYDAETLATRFSGERADGDGGEEPEVSEASDAAPTAEEAAG